ncbi:DUF1631 family protein [Ramlibacter albus]|uniref:DUF1631 family protein n=1 Tax=Ramlibacter albus TaxID=2079448 RepID=A0A923MAI4_9BURK|nr:DUF1631 family protein [Ramlibacter albus]MBC5765926.1 DUF1631 family protein [Ramlibacter albus]
MAKLLKRMGVADDPTALQPSLNDCIEAMLGHCDTLIIEMLVGLTHASTPGHPRHVRGFQQPGIKAGIDSLNRQGEAVREVFKAELTRLVYEGGGKETVATEALRFEDLKLFEDEQLDASIEVARAQQEVATAVDDVLPAVDALVSTLLGWRTIQPGLNPLRPEVFVRALQHTLSVHLPEVTVREALVAPAAGLLGVNLRKLYRELADWLTSTGVEPAVPLGGRASKGTGAPTQTVADSVAKTLLTLDKLRKLLAGDFDSPKPRQEFLHTVPASMALLQDLKGGSEALIKRLEQRQKPTPAPAAPVDMLAEPPAQPNAPSQRIGQQLGDEVVRLMFDNLAQDQRLLPGFKKQLKAIEPAVQKLAEEDSRFFSDRNHPARQLLDKVTQRSLAFSSETDEGWARFVVTVEKAFKWAAESKVADADTFGELLDTLHKNWSGDDQNLRAKREEAARALLHAEQRNLLAQKLASEFAASLEGLEVADFIADFLKNSWSQVVAEAELSCVDGQADPFGYRALVDDLIWSVQKSTAQRGRARRLVQMIPGLIAKLREGLDRIGYPPELTQRFFDHLITLHKDAVQEGADPEVHAAADSAWSEPSKFGDTKDEQDSLWLDKGEAEESGFVDQEQYFAPEHVASPEAPQEEKEAEGAAPLRVDELRVGSWVELNVGGRWIRAQLTWCSPHGTLFMFTAQVGTAHSMSRRTLDKLRAMGHIKVVADRNVIDEALDQVAQQALKNSLGDKKP